MRPSDTRLYSFVVEYTQCDRMEDRDENFSHWVPHPGTRKTVNLLGPYLRDDLMTAFCLEQFKFTGTKEHPANPVILSMEVIKIDDILEIHR